ncbi:hypothetical protein HWN36_01495 [Methanofollis tationis]|uniref:Uncharacterized protein n=2 Tax=Methanofollis tationis TaxID=81417 RepID=A0A7K4HLE6_9EURY|nr:hypothetical protein [Methanofollis tationis]
MPSEENVLSMQERDQVLSRLSAIEGFEHVLYYSDERFLYDIALETIREFDDFKHRLYDYIGEKVII